GAVDDGPGDAGLDHSALLEQHRVAAVRDPLLEAQQRSGHPPRRFQHFRGLDRHRGDLRPPLLSATAEESPRTTPPLRILCPWLPSATWNSTSQCSASPAAGRRCCCPPSTAAHRIRNSSAITI